MCGLQNETLHSTMIIDNACHLFCLLGSLFYKLSQMLLVSREMVNPSDMMMFISLAEKDNCLGGVPIELQIQ